MVESVTKTPCELKNTGAIMGKLEENLKGKKLFLVLDDVWNNDKHLWDSFKSQLQKIGVLAGSVILVTTRSNDVAKKASASCLHELRGLWKEDGWALLKQQVSFDSSFNDVGRRILDKCKGVPLAIKAIGGILQLMESHSDWLENLRHIETSRWLVASKGMGQLTSLQTLPYLKLCDREGWTIDELGPLYQVKGEINIEGLEYVKNKEEAREARLKRKDKILKLSFHWSFSGEEEVNYGGQINSSIIERCNHDKDVLESLEPHPNIQSLRIMGYMGVRFPRWMREMGGHPTTQLNSLTNVELYTCDRCLQLPSLGMLPNLKVLCLSELNAVECIGEEFYYSNNNSCAEVGVNKKVLFPNLRELSIMDFESLTTWEPPSSSATVLPSLETLLIVTCPKLRKIPTSLENCTSLQNLEIEDCPSIEGEGSVPNLGKLHGLINLRLHDTGELLSLLPLWIPHLRSLIELSIAGLREEWDITLMSSLAPFRSLSLVGCRNFKPLPAQQVFPALHMSSTLQSLVIFGFDEMEALPEWIGKLLSLQTLHLSNCNKLKYLFSTQAMLQLAQLQCLYIQACPLLTERCEKDSNGPESEWHKISHLSNIRIDWVTIQDLR
ncbi:putative disease resistance protein RGA3 [Bienertia sinuspersici]